MKKILYIFRIIGYKFVSDTEIYGRINILLEKLLSDDPVRDVRLNCARTIKELHLFDKIFNKMKK